MIKRLFLCLIIATITTLSGCLPDTGTFPVLVMPTPVASPTPVMNDETLLSVALTDISENHIQNYGNDSSKTTDKYLIEELNKLLSKRVYKEEFDAKIEVINAVWLIPNDNPAKRDLLLIIDCNGQQENCTIKKTASETILFLQWVPNWTFPTQTRYVFFYICNTKNRRGYIKVTGDNLNAYINGLLPGESLATLIHIEEIP